jgi:cysteine-rich repeat protein
VQTGVEGCDDGNEDNTDACPDDAANGGTCEPARCGDGFVLAGVEECDDGNAANTDTCLDDAENGGACTAAVCGDGVIQAGVEGCDDGNHDNSDDCPDDGGNGGTCQAATCGDGVVHAGVEECDDGNHDNADACSDDTATGGACLSATCGDGFVAAGVEACDDGNHDNTDGCLDDTTNGGTCVLATCGDGFVQAGVEGCDDGNHDNSDACPDDAANGGTCVSASCGDGFVLAGAEACDDGNLDNSDGCLDDVANGGTCGVATCGDGFVQAGVEACDDGNHLNTDACLDDVASGGTCSVAACGDGFVQAGVEVCDDGNNNDYDGCAGDCSQQAVCGNGVHDALAGEPCDDDNAVDWDGCNTCTISEIQVNTTTAGAQANPDIAMNGAGAFVVVWETTAANVDVAGQRFAADGTKQGLELAINTSVAGDQRDAAVAMSADGAFVVVWRDVAAGQIVARRFDAAGAAVTGEITVGAGAGYAPDVAMAADHSFKVTWSTGTALWYRAFDAAAAPVGAAVQVATGVNVASPRIASGATGAFGIAWQADGVAADAFARMYDAAGVPMMAAVQLNTFTAGAQGNPDVGMDDSGRFVVVWESFGQFPAVQFNGGYDIFMQRFSAAGVAQAATEEHVNTESALWYQRMAGLGMNGAGAMVVSFSSERYTFGEDVIVRRYDASGAQAGPEVRANGYLLLDSNSEQLESRAAMASDGSFAGRVAEQEPRRRGLRRLRPALRPEREAPRLLELKAPASCGPRHDRVGSQKPPAIGRQTWRPVPSVDSSSPARRGARRTARASCRTRRSTGPTRGSSGAPSSATTESRR